MSTRAADVLELLLPEVGGERQARARKTVTFLRLLTNSASPRRATSVRLALAGARSELERAQCEKVIDALRDLVAHHLAAARTPESFLDVGTPRRTHDRAWALLSEERAEVAGLPHVPSPGEAPLEVAARLIACAERLGLVPEEVALWRARHTRLAAGVRAGERAFLALLAAAASPGGPHLRALALAGAAECLLDRGAVLQAGALLREHSALDGSHGSLARLAGWVRLLTGDEGGARGPAPAERRAAARLPAPLVQLRRSRPDWLPRLAGVAARGRAPRVERIEARGELGAAVLAVFSLGDAGAVRVVHVDCAPALRAALTGWLDGRDGACRRPGELEHEMIARAEVVVAHALEGCAPRGCLKPGTIRAVALAPISDRGGELRGWLRLECEHHLLPSAARLRALARAWREEVRPLPAASSLEPPLELEGGTGPGALPDPRAEVLRALFDSLGAKTAQRRWWAVARVGATLRLLAEGGGAFEAWRQQPGGGRGLRRALVAQGSVRFDRPDSGVSIAAAAASGVVVPVVHRGRTLALLAVESMRRGDAHGLQRGLERAAGAGALALCVAGFRAWHLSRWGHDVTFDVGLTTTAALVEDLLAAASATGPVTLSGPAGSGKRVLARWLHYESGREDCLLGVHACGAHDPATEERELFGPDPESEGLLQRARGGTLVLDDPERLPPALQARLERWLIEEPHGTGASARGQDVPPARLVLATRAPLAASLASGRLRQDLAQRLQRLELQVPGLAERRDEIPTLVRQLAQRFALELGQAVPQLDDEALALLWRQPWTGNVRELENVVYRLVLCGGEHLGVAQVEAVARRLRLEPTRRIPPREAPPALLAAALRSTRTLRGTPNKTRAALYLGWDPDTLARRLADAGLDPGRLLR